MLQRFVVPWNRLVVTFFSLCVCVSVCVPWKCTTDCLLKCFFTVKLSWLLHGMCVSCTSGSIFVWLRREHCKIHHTPRVVLSQLCMLHRLASYFPTHLILERAEANLLCYTCLLFFQRSSYDHLWHIPQDSFEATTTTKISVVICMMITVCISILKCHQNV